MRCVTIRVQRPVRQCRRMARHPSIRRCPAYCQVTASRRIAHAGLSTEQYPPYVPYFIDINAILNLDLYLTTIAVCGHDGVNCDPREPILANTAWNKAPACQAANNNMVIPA